MWEKWKRRSMISCQLFQKSFLEKNLAPAKNVPFYAHWVSRFLDYARRNEFSALEYQEAAVLGFLDSLKTAKKAITETDASDFKNFLSHLALAQRVSASTQNQAFNAILFFFRYVLGKEVGNLADTVRAKRGQKLPVVFSVEEVKRLLACMNGKDLLSVMLPIFYPWSTPCLCS